MATTASHLLRLPLELLIPIAEELEQRDRHSLALTNRQFHAITNPLLYVRDLESESPSCLFWAAAAGRLGTLDTALGYGAGPKLHRVRTQDKQSLSLIHLATKGGHLEVVDWLLDQGADIDEPSVGACSCRAYVPRPAWPHPSLQPERLTQRVKWRPLHIAMCNRHASVAELLIRRGAFCGQLDAEERNPNNNYTALHHAAANGLVSVISLLARRNGFDINERDLWGDTALHHAARARGPRDRTSIERTLHTLVALGASVEALNDDGLSPLDFSLTMGSFAVALELVQMSAKHRSDASSLRFPLLCCALPLHELAPTWKVECGNTSLDDGELDSLRVPLMQVLLDAGADTETPCPRDIPCIEDGCTALDAACRFHLLPAIRVLLANGAAINVQNGAGYTPLGTAYATACGKLSKKPLASRPTEQSKAILEITRLLVRRGARIDARPEDDESPLEIALHRDLGWLDVMLSNAGRDNIPKQELLVMLGVWVAEASCYYRVPSFRAFDYGIFNYDDPKDTDRVRRAADMLFDFTDRVYGIDEEACRFLADAVMRNPWIDRRRYWLLVLAETSRSREQLLLVRSLWTDPTVLSITHESVSSNV